MDPPTRFEEPLAEGYAIHIECQEKAEMGDCKSQPRRQSPRHSASPKTVSSLRRILLATTVCLLVVLVFVTAVPQRVLRRISCHGDLAGEHAIGPEPESTPFSSLLNGASPETLGDLLHKYFPTRYPHGVWPSERHAVEAIHREDAPLATTLVRLARRQDNSTTSSTSSSSSSSSSSTSPPPARGGDSTTSTSSTTSTTTTTSSSSTSQSTSATAEPSPTVNQQNPSTTTIPGTSTSPSKETRVADPTTTTATKTTTSSKDGEVTSTAKNEPPPPTRINGATITTSTTLPGGQIVPVTITSSRTSKVVIATLTSTLSNGRVVVVTSTSFVPPDPAVTMETTTMHPPSLHNAARERHQIGGMALAGLMGVMVGAALV